MTVAQPIRRQVIEYDEYTGRIEAAENVEVRARVGGYLTEVKFQEGALVKKDQLLYVIDPRPYQAEYDGALSQIAREQAKLEFAASEFTRIEKLEKDQAASEFEYATKKQNLDQARASVSAAKAAADTARLDLEFTHITSPIDGRISRTFVTVGNLINSTTPLTTITSIDPIYCYVDTDEGSVLRYRQLAREKKRVSARDAAIPVRMALLNETDFPHEGIVDFLDNHVDPATGTMRARGTFRNADGYLTPGYFARVRVAGSGQYDALLVSDEAVGSDQSRKFLLVLGPDDTVQYRAVTLGALFGNLRAIMSGLRGDEWVVVSGVLRARPGTKVSPQRATMPDRGSPAGQIQTAASPLAATATGSAAAR